MFKKKKLNFHHQLILIAIFLIISVINVQSEDIKDYGGIEFITLSGGSGDWALISGKIADVISKSLKGIIATATPGGGVVNLSRIQRGEAQLGLAHSAVTEFALKGIDPFEGEHDKLRTIMTLWKSYTHAVIPRKSDINSISDFAKKPYSISISKPGLAQHVIVNALLEAAGITPEDIVNAGGVVHVAGMDDEMEMMRDRRLDFMLFQVVYPFSMIMDLNTGVGIKLLPIEGEFREKVLELVPGLMPDIIPAGSYDGQDQDIATTIEFSQLLCSSDLTDDLVYDITKALFENIPEFQMLSTSLSTISEDYAPLPLGIELHSGAKKFYKEQGVLKE